MAKYHFILALYGFIFCLAVFSGSLMASDEQKYLFLSLEDAIAAAGFNPNDPESFTVVFTADLHYGTGDPDQILPPIIKEINSMKPFPKFFGIAGDLICKASLHFGQVPDQKQKEEAITEFRLLKDRLGLLESEIPAKIALGNHDTYPGEDDPVLFHSVFPDVPEYNSFTIMNIHFVFLNGGSAGYIDHEQRDWFRNDIKHNTGPDTTLVIICHQPSLGSVTSERGIPEAMRDVLSDYESEVWMVAGHAHHNSDQCFKLPKSIMTQATITSGNPTGWGTGNPGYWIYGFSKGKLATRIFRKLGEGYSIASLPKMGNARPMILPFEGREEILWKVMVGEGDKPYLVDAKAAWCLNYWHYNKYLVYKFPLSLADNKATNFALLETPSGNEPRRYFVSPDAENWEEVTTVHREGSYTSFPIPQRCLDSETIAVRVEQCVVSGFALTK